MLACKTSLMKSSILSCPSIANASSGKAQEYHTFLVRVRVPTLAPILKEKLNGNR